MGLEAECKLESRAASLGQLMCPRLDECALIFRRQHSSAAQTASPLTRHADSNDKQARDREDDREGGPGLRLGAAGVHCRIVVRDRVVADAGAPHCPPVVAPVAHAVVPSVAAVGALSPLAATARSEPPAGRVALEAPEELAAGAARDVDGAAHAEDGLVIIVGGADLDAVLAGRDELWELLEREAELLRARREGAACRDAAAVEGARDVVAEGPGGAVGAGGKPSHLPLQHRARAGAGGGLAKADLGHDLAPRDLSGKGALYNERTGHGLIVNLLDAKHIVRPGAGCVKGEGIRGHELMGCAGRGVVVHENFPHLLLRLAHLLLRLLPELAMLLTNREAAKLHQHRASQHSDHGAARFSPLALSNWTRKETITKFESEGH